MDHVTQQSVSKPFEYSNLSIDQLVGVGTRSKTYRGNYLGRRVAVKVYRQSYIQKYRERYGIDIADFEYQRNASFYAVDSLRPYTAQPIAVLRGPTGSGPTFIQEFVEGVTLEELAPDLGGLPNEILEAGRFIVQEASRAGLYDIDLSAGNVIARRTETGWHPIIYDFNLLPQYLYPPNPFVFLWYKLGIRRKAHRDHRCLRDWERLSKRCQLGG